MELLFLKEFTPENILRVAAFFYGYGVPLGWPAVCITFAITMATTLYRM
jgi:hypothetical protein